MTDPRWPSDAAVEAALRMFWTQPPGCSERDWMRAALIATERAAWQPIESAPKDGTEIMLWIEFTEPVIDIGCWKSDHGESGCFRYDGDDGPDDIQPTMWRPLPAPPAQGDGE